MALTRSSNVVIKYRLSFKGVPVNITATHNQHNALASQFIAKWAKQRCSTCRTRGLYGQFHDAKQEAHDAAQLVIVHSHQTVHVLLCQTKRVRHGKWCAEAVRDGVDFLNSLGLAGRATAIHGIGAIRFHAKNLAVRTELLDGIGYTTDQSATSDWHHQCVKVGNLFANLQANRTGTRCYRRTLKRVHEKPSLFFLDTFCFLKGPVRIVDEHHLPTIST